MRDGDDDPGLLEAFCPVELRDGVKELTPALYRDLKRIAHRERVRLFSPSTMTTTALIHESYLKLKDKAGFQSLPHFLRVAAVTMRHILIDRVRAQQAARRGGGAHHVSLDETSPREIGELIVENDELVLSIHEALIRLAQVSPRQAEVVQCRYFGGFSNQEIAQALGVTERTVERDWAEAKAWLAAELGDLSPGT